MTASAAKKAAGSAACLQVKSAPQKAAQAAARGTEKVEKKVKSGIKGFIKRQADKVVSKAASVSKRMSEEVEELKATGLFSDSEIEAIMEADSLAAMQARSKSVLPHKESVKALLQLEETLVTTIP